MADRRQTPGDGSAGDRHEVVIAVQHEGGAPSSGHADRAQRVVDHRDALVLPSEEAPEKLAQLDRAAALGDQREAADADLVAGFELDVAAAGPVKPGAVLAAEIVE